MFEKQIKKMTTFDLSLLKLGVAAFVLAVIKWQPIMNWVHNTNVWWFIAIAIISIVILQFRIWKK